MPVARRSAPRRAALADLQLKRVDVPTPIVHATADRTASFIHATRAAARIPAARLVPAGANHATTLVAPEAQGAIAGS